ncbi:MAG TPA: DUF547 domain-containing protein [Thermoanaerobaculia bacterium]|jgi:hypothetical protein
MSAGRRPLRFLVRAVVLASVASMASLAAVPRPKPVGAQPDPAVWDAILSARARGGGFDYKAADGQDRKRLAAYLANLGDANPRDLAPEERKAFFINAYNAMAVAVVLEHYPIESIRNVEGAFQTVRKRIGGEMLTLDDVESRLRDLKDARIHFAIVCAAKSSPPLLPRAYRAAMLSAELDAQGRAYVRDSTRNVIDPAEGTLELSQVFEWSRKELEREAGTVGAFVARFTTPAVADWLRTFAKSPEFLPFDWALNQPR